jgi:hypothetical protein
MPASEQRVVNCPCGAKLLLRWTWSIGSAIYPVRCPIAAQSIAFMLPRRLRYIDSTPRATGNTSQRSTERRPNRPRDSTQPRHRKHLRNEFLLLCRCGYGR